MFVLEVKTPAAERGLSKEFGTKEPDALMWQVILAIRFRKGWGSDEWVTWSKIFLTVLL